MSSNYTAGQWVGTIVGAVVGFYTGGAGWAATASAMASGAAVGGAIGGAIDPPPGPHIVGPRLSDLAQQGASYGAVIPRVYGSSAMAGNIFWIENNALKETSKTEGGGGKGGGGGATTETFSYSATFALGLCEGPIAGVRRIWISGKLVYDAGSDDMGTIRATNAAAAGLRIYLGNDTQAADSRMQATLGVANTPAYRGLAYIVFEDLQLADYGNTLIGAQIKVEVLGSGEYSDYLAVARSITTGNYDKSVWDGRQFIAVSFAPLGVQRSYDGVTWSACTLPAPLSVYGGIATDGNGTTVIIASSSQMFRTTDGVIWTSNLLPFTHNWSDVGWCGNKFIAVAHESVNWAHSSNGEAWGPITGPIALKWGYVRYIAGKTLVLQYLHYTIPAEGAPYAWSDDGGSWHLHGTPTATWFGSMYSYSTGALLVISCYNELSGTWQALTTEDGLNWTTYTTNLPTCGLFFDGLNWLFLEPSNPYINATKDFVIWEQIALPVNGLRGGSYNGSYSVVANDDGGIMTLYKPRLTSALVPLSEIIETEVLRSGLLSAADIVTTSLTDGVRGYRIASVAAIRSNIEPVQGAWPFDIVQSGYQVKFKRRGGASVATIPAADLGAGADGEASVARFSESRDMATQLPARVNISYMDAYREYDMGEQYAERLNTGSVNIRALEMPLVFSADEAVQKAEILLYMYWLERYDVAFKLPPQYGYLEPADVVTVLAESGTYELRLTGVNYLSNGIIECTAKFNSAAVYSSIATSDTGALPDGTISLPVGSVTVLLDIPLMMDEYNTPGFVAAMSGVVSGWPGGSLFRSADAGQTWLLANGFTVQSGIGSTAGAMSAPTDDRMIDKTGTLTAYFYGGFALSSVTEAQMLNGANHFAYGVHGRWEIIAAQNCTLQTDGSYVLTDFLRGRYGSGWAAGLHVAGDALVLLDSRKLQFSSTNLNLIGTALDYVGVTAGQTLDSGARASFAYSGVNLECLSPVYPSGSRHQVTNDWSISWIRRTRLGGEWRDYVDATLGEPTEAYEVEIYSDATYSTLKRTISGLTTPAATYSSANQAADFGGNQGNIYLKIYQLSNTVGRGYPLNVALSSSLNLAPGVARYWRVYMTAFGDTTSFGSYGFLQIQEIEMHETIGGADVTTPASMVISDGAWFGAFAPALAFDNGVSDQATQSYASSNITSASTKWVGVDFGLGNEKSIDELKIWPPTGMDGYHRWPTAFSLQSSNDGVTWATKKSWSGLTSGWTSGTGRIFN